MQQISLELPAVSVACRYRVMIRLQGGDPKVQMCDEIPVGVLDIAQDMRAVRVSGGLYGASNLDALNAEFRSLDELSKESSGFAHDEDYRREMRT
jgi:hypothetical protein